MTDKAREALAELVNLRDLEDDAHRLFNARAPGWDVKWREWERRKPLAWAAARAALAETQPSEDKTAPTDSALVEWVNCESRRPWATNSLHTRLSDLRAASNRCRRAFNNPYMGVVANYVAEAYDAAGAAIESYLNRIYATMAARSTLRGGEQPRQDVAEASGPDDQSSRAQSGDRGEQLREPVQWRTSWAVIQRLQRAAKHPPGQGAYSVGNHDRAPDDIWRTVLLSDLQEILKHVGTQGSSHTDPDGGVIEGKNRTTGGAIGQP